VIRLENISKIYSTDYVLKDINWEIKKGEKIGLVGSNGAGKTTQFKILKGEEEQTSGFVIKEGKPKIAYLKQEFALQSNLTVREELESSFHELKDIEKKIEILEQKMISIKDSKDQVLLNSQIKQISLLQSQYETLGGYRLKIEVDKLLPELGFSSKDADEFVGNFSCGWQMKIALGKIILQKPDLLLLDEPTNHLDLDTISWLEKYLITLKNSIILISHDRYFLDKLCKKIIFIENGVSKTYRGNYSFFVEQKLLEDELYKKAYLLQSKEIESQKEYIEKFRASASRSSQAKSREKQINKIIKLTEQKKQNNHPSFLFPTCPRSGRSVLEIKNLCHCYGEKIIFFEANLKINAGEKVAFLGPNGSGKSTLFKLITKKIMPEIGEVNLGKHNLFMSYFAQNQAEALDLDKIIIDLIFDKAPNWSQHQVRTFLGGFGFQDETVFKNVRQLSGGEKSRLAMALLILKPSNFLLLDEPTNHLDLQSKENLERALNVYQGTVLIISHDRFFISKVANRIVEIENSELHSYKGNYEYYLEKK
tara:strand:- start:2862 stop:4472 length:1611 start_codon:yes stop_codon:yes gene_type:complete